MVPFTMGLIVHLLRCGATRSGKSKEELKELLTLARAMDCAILLLDPHGTLAREFLINLDLYGMLGRVIYDRLSDTDMVPRYDWLTTSQAADEFKRLAEDDEQRRQFISLLIKEENKKDTSNSPMIEQGLMDALMLYMAQKTPVPLYWLRDVYLPFSNEANWMIENCTDENVKRRFEQYHHISPSQRRTETGPADRRLRRMFGAPSFMIRCGATFDFHEFLWGNGILIMDGSSKGDLSRDAASMMMGSVLLKTIEHCRTHGKGRVVVVLDEAVNANLVNAHVSRALAESAKWGLEFHILVQDPLTFPSDEIRENVLQNTAKHFWYRQGSPQAAELAAKDVGTPVLDPLKVHHTEYRTRIADDGYEQISTGYESQSKDKYGKTISKGSGTNRSYRLKRKEVQEAQDRYTTLNDQLTLIAKELMSLRPGERFIRGDTGPTYFQMERTPWDSFAGLYEARLEQALQRVKQSDRYKKPQLLKAPSKPAPPTSATKGFGRRGTTR